MPQESTCFAHDLPIDIIYVVKFGGALMWKRSGLGIPGQRSAMTPDFRGCRTLHHWTIYRLINRKIQFEDLKKLHLYSGFISHF